MRATAAASAPPLNGARPDDLCNGIIALSDCPSTKRYFRINRYLQLFFPRQPNNNKPSIAHYKYCTVHNIPSDLYSEILSCNRIYYAKHLPLTWNSFCKRSTDRYNDCLHNHTLSVKVLVHIPSQAIKWNCARRTGLYGLKHDSLNTGASENSLPCVF